VYCTTIRVHPKSVLYHNTPADGQYMPLSCAQRLIFFTEPLSPSRKCTPKGKRKKRKFPYGAVTHMTHKVREGVGTGTNDNSTYDHCSHSLPTPVRSSQKTMRCDRESCLCDEGCHPAPVALRCMRALAHIVRYSNLVHVVYLGNNALGLMNSLVLQNNGDYF